VLSPDYGLIQTRVLDYFYQLIDREFEQSEQSDIAFTEELNKRLNQEIGNIEKITGPLDKLKNLGGIVSYDFAKELSSNGVLKALYA
jgi:hypothetical protein